MPTMLSGRPATSQQQQRFAQRRADFIHRTLNNYPGQTLLSLRIVLPGKVQKNSTISQFFSATQQAFQLTLRRTGLQMTQFQITTWQTNAGCQAFYLSKLSDQELATNAADFLRHYPGAPLCQLQVHTLALIRFLPMPTITATQAEKILTNVYPI